MKLQAIEGGKFRRRVAARCAQTVVLAAMVVFGSLVADRPAGAGAGGGGAAAAAAVGTAGMGACSSNAGTALYSCVAGVLDQMSNTVYRSPEVQRSLQTAASQLRAATNKSQALSAISQCRSALAGIMQKVRSAGRDGEGLSAITGVLAQAARLIQSKG